MWAAAGHAAQEQEQVTAVGRAPPERMGGGGDFVFLVYPCKCFLFFWQIHSGSVQPAPPASLLFGSTIYLHTTGHWPNGQFVFMHDIILQRNISITKSKKIHLNSHSDCYLEFFSFWNFDWRFNRVRRRRLAQPSAADASYLATLSRVG